MSESLSREEVLFHEALSRPASARPAFLEQACAGDSALRERLSALLEANDTTGDLLGRPLVAGDSGWEERPGSRIGRYKLLQKIGEGGCGTVYLADQVEPVHRRVALKVIKLGMDTREVISRFEAERQALALMDHPNIAHVLDAGATRTGRPYFVMELVRGLPITRYCDEHGLATAERLGLFVQVCQAVQHAHQKGIIHRDLKPSNILVTVNDGMATPKVIDFGIAKATQGRLTNETLFTAFEQFVGTPAYMSPEQATLTSLDVDTRSDVYSLGVLLYELLTGRTPFDTQDLLQAGIDEIRRRIREVDPPKPSNRLSTLGGEALKEAARHRRIEAPKLISLVRGDLDWIVMRCLEKDRGRRYSTATGLADDIQRYLHQQPVSASPPRALYRFGKFARRNRLGVAAALAIAVALVIGSGVATWQAVRATEAEFEAALALQEARVARGTAERARLVAERGQREAEVARTAEAEHRRVAEDNEKRARSAAARSAQVAQFMKRMLTGVGPRVALGRDTKLLRDILDDTAGRIDRDLTEEPAVAAELRQTLAGTYAELGDQVKALAMYERLLARQRELPHPDLRATADALLGIGRAQLMLRRYAEAEKSLRQAKSYYQRLQAFAQEQYVDGRLAWALKIQGRGEECVEVLKARLEAAKKHWGEPSAPVANAMVGLGHTAHALPGRSLEESEALLRGAVQMYRQVDPGGTSACGALNGLALVLMSARRYAEAEEIFRELLPLWRRNCGDRDHPDLALPMGNMAAVLREQGKLAESESLLREVVSLVRRFMGNDHASLAFYLGRLGGLLTATRHWEEAESCLQEAMTIQERLALDADRATTVQLLVELETARENWPAAERWHRERLNLIEISSGGKGRTYAGALAGWASFLRRRDRAQEAEAVERTRADLLQKLDSTVAVRASQAVGSRGDALKELGRRDEAKESYLAELAERRREPGDHHAEISLLLYKLSQLCLGTRDLPEAEAVLREIVDGAREKSGYVYVNSLHNLGYVLTRQGRLTEAESHLRHVLGLLRANTRSYVTATYTVLAENLQLQNRRAEVPALWREAIAYAKENYGDTCEDVARYTAALARTLLDLGELAVAEPLARESLALHERLAPTALPASEARGLLGEIVGRLGRTAEAEGLLTAAYAAVEHLKTPAARQARRVAARRLADLYAGWGRPDREEEWRRTLRELEVAAPTAVR